MDKLLPCPFCRETMIRTRYVSDGEKKSIYYEHPEGKCILGGIDMTEQPFSFLESPEKIEAWNRREFGVLV